jgi:ubiquitin C-terminal hydrolase
MKISFKFQKLYRNAAFIVLLTGNCNNCKNTATIQEVLTNPKNPPHIEYIEKVYEFGNPVKNQGIPNIGNSCYMNSVLQILASFYRELFFNSNEETELVKAANNIIKSITSQEKASLAEIKAKASLFFDTIEKSHVQGGINWVNKRGTQEDAEELLTAILGKFNLPTAHTVGEEIHPTTGEERIFEGPNPWTICQISFPENNSAVKTMQDLFNNSLLSGTVKKRWSGSNEFGKEPKIKVKHTPVLKDLEKLYGKILTIHLKRFTNNNGVTSKIRQEVGNPFDLKIEKKHILNSYKDRYYKLAGFIQHLGRTKGGGHYEAYTKVAGQWIRYNDDRVTEVSDTVAEDAAKKAYIYFYKPARPRKSE